MPQRSMSQRALAEATFPIRIKVRIPPTGLGRDLIELLRWLAREVGEGNFARHDTETLEEEALAIHFRRPEDLNRFLASFPRLELADETRSRAYASSVARHQS